MNVRENLKAYLDGELNAQETKQVEEAVAQDPALKKELEELKSLSQTLQAMARQPEPKGYEATKQRLAPARRSTPFFWKALGTAAVLSLLAALLFPVFSKPENAARRMFSDADMAASETEAVAATAEMAAPAEAPSTAKAKAERMPADESIQNRGRYSSESEEEVSEDALTKDSVKRSLGQLATPHHIIKTGNLTIKVESLDASKRRIWIDQIVKDNNGYIESSYDDIDPIRKRTSTMDFTLRVQAPKFERTITALEALGERVSGTTDQEDVTAQIVDYDARLKALKAEETQYVELIEKAKNVNEVLDVRYRLTEVRQTIEQIEAQRKSLADQAALSTIHLTLTQDPLPTPKPAPKDWYSTAVSNATNLLNSLAKLLAQAAIYFGVLTPIWLPIAAIALWRNKRQD